MKSLLNFIVTLSLSVNQFILILSPAPTRFHVRSNRSLTLLVEY